MYIILYSEISGNASVCYVDKSLATTSDKNLEEPGSEIFSCLMNFCLDPESMRNPNSNYFKHSRFIDYLFIFLYKLWDIFPNDVSSVMMNKNPVNSFAENSIDYSTRPLSKFCYIITLIGFYFTGKFLAYKTISM